MAAKVTYEADIIPVGVKIVAFPGDELIVVQGVCIGIRSKKPAALPTAGGVCEPSPTEDTILKVVSDKGPINAFNISHELGFTKADTACRSIVSSLIQGMVKKGSIVPANDSRIPRYVVSGSRPF